MPTYEYACKQCGEHLEVVQSFKDDALTECPNCEGQLRKVFSATGIIFKGSGWHIKDYKTGSSGTAAAASSDAASADGGSSKDGSSSKDAGSAKDGGSSTSGSSSGSGSSDSASSSSTPEAKSA